MAKERKNSLLTEEEAGDPGCGAGTSSACYALKSRPIGWECTKISDPDLAQIRGRIHFWKVNTDPADGKAWCPKGVLKNSKLLPSR